MVKTKIAIIGSGNIGTDLMFKVMHNSESLEVGALVGIDPESDGLLRAHRLGIPTVSTGVAGLLELDTFDDIAIVFDATSAQAHIANAELLAPYGKRLVDLTPAAIGPYTIPTVNLEQNLDAPNVNMVTCGGQATIPIVAAISMVTPVHYAEIVATIASKSAGPGTRANIDEFTETTSLAIERVGGAKRGKAIIVLNPADPPVVMRDTVLALIDLADDAVREQVTKSIARMAEEVAQYVPGYRLKHTVQFAHFAPETPMHTLVDGIPAEALTQVSVFLAVEGAGAYLPSYAGNLDIMTSAALRVGERIAEQAGAVSISTEKATVR
ncbi:acetaldehyde dehydrogenase (acetylating) [Arthrobacter sp. MMS18-M83]|uniref:acetaldehyde dehydrogenase (acetylating) n=1 Tax=Arthrobacter sp. MMS18-M83 TaxID=2996261 RepID=UPI00227A4507|nr:acetaldehyde dehydrogenase (acetylating) [Arthrobacter sp. MMS18-M83]WAH97660.1 acetaldehyde dehydrogenase (acetylating) [Arthrobacter sp. MMS18-M83]